LHLLANNHLRFCDTNVVYYKKKYIFEHLHATKKISTFLKGIPVQIDSLYISKIRIDLTNLTFDIDGVAAHASLQGMFAKWHALS